MPDINLFKETNFQLKCNKCKKLISGYLKYQYNPDRIETSEFFTTITQIKYMDDMVFEILCDECYEKSKE